MSSIGNRTVSVYTMRPDAVTYAGPTNSVSHVDVIDAKRTLPTRSSDPLRSNLRFERGFPVATAEGAPAQEAPVVVSIAVSVAKGTTPANVKAFVNDSLIQAATVVGDLAITGDIHLE